MYVCMYEHYLHEFSEGEGNPSGPWTESWKECDTNLQ